MLTRVFKAGHWPSQPLFDFFDRDGDGLVSVEDFVEGQVMRALPHLHSFRRPLRAPPVTC